METLSPLLSTAFTSSTLVQMLNAGNIPGAANEFDRWIYS